MPSECCRPVDPLLVLAQASPTGDTGENALLMYTILEAVIRGNVCEQNYVFGRPKEVLAAVE